MKLKYVNLSSNPIGPKGFKLLLPYLHLLINKNNELNLRWMNLNDQSMTLLSEELYKYSNIKKIDIRGNRNIHGNALKDLFFKFPVSKIELDISSRSKELLIDKTPELIKYINLPCFPLNLSSFDIEDEFFKSFIDLRLNKVKMIRRMDLSKNNLTYKSVEVLISYLSSLPNLQQLHLYENEIGDDGMKILSPHLHLLTDYFEINCSKMGLSSDGLKYLLDGLKSINGKVKLDLSGNIIDSNGIEYLMNYIKDINNIEKLFIQNNLI